MSAISRRCAWSARPSSPTRTHASGKNNTLPRAVALVSPDFAHPTSYARRRSRTVTVLSPRAQKRGSYPPLPRHRLASTKAV
jgi:hypothetical protein